MATSPLGLRNKGGIGSTRARRPIMLGVVGDSAAGKTTLTRGIENIFGQHRVNSICTDDYHRYDREARNNQATAGLYELDVRKASLESDRHRDRSTNFFYAMLAAQGGVTIATFAIALRRRSFLWGVATAAGLAAVTFASYVFLKM